MAVAANLFGEWEEPERESPIPEEPAELKVSRFRRIAKCQPPVGNEDALSIEEARAVIQDVGVEYLKQPNPAHALVIVGSPGLGKTTAGIRTAEWAVEQGQRVGYLGPRHDFFGDVTRIAKRPADWYEWLPRQAADNRGKSETCRYVEPINTWMARGYQSIDFCQRFCGWDYINGECAYYAQKKQTEPVIYGQHQHATLGHPIQFDAIIGDELPLSAFMHRWAIPAKYVMPPGMNPAEPITEVVSELADLASRGVQADGAALMKLLGGATRVREAAESSTIPIGALAVKPSVRTVYDVDSLPFFHLPQLITLLSKESRVAEFTDDYPTRLALSTGGHLVMLLRRKVSDKLPSHVIWLDATANQKLYETLLGRPVQIVAPRVKLRGRVFQVYDRQNGKGSLFKQEEGKEAKTTAKFDQLKAQIARIAAKYKRVSVITYKALEEKLGSEIHELDRGHFYAERGTNRFEGVDALIVAGVPQPSLWDMEATAKMLFWSRMRSFAPGGKLPWAVHMKPFQFADDQGQGREYPVSDFGADVELNAVLWQYREAELIQAAHRARPNLRDVDVWLLENLPIDELPPTELLEVRELFGAPVGVDCYRWPQILDLATLYEEEGQELTVQAIAEHIGVKRDTNRRYLQAIFASQPGRWEWAVVASNTGKGGRPRKALRPIQQREASL